MIFNMKIAKLSIFHKIYAFGYIHTTEMSYSGTIDYLNVESPSCKQDRINHGALGAGVPGPLDF